MKILFQISCSAANLVIWMMTVISASTHAHDMPYFASAYTLQLHVDEQKIQIGELTRFPVAPDPQHWAESHYRTRMTVKLYCNILDQLAHLGVADYISDSCRLPGLELDQNGVVTYCFDAFLPFNAKYNTNTFYGNLAEDFRHEKLFDDSDFIYYRNPVYDRNETQSTADRCSKTAPKIPDEIIPGSLLNKAVANNKTVQETALFGELGLYSSSMTDPWLMIKHRRNHYFTVFMSMHHEMRLNAILTNTIMEPGIPCTLGLMQWLYSYLSDFASPWLGRGKLSHYDYYTYEPPYRVKYSCLLPQVSNLPYQFDALIDSLEPLFWTSYKVKSIPLDHNYPQPVLFGTVFPLFLDKNRLVAEPDQKDITPAPLYYRHLSQLRKISDTLLVEEESPLSCCYSRGDATKTYYHLSPETREWQKITVFENEKPLISFEARPIK